MFVEHSLCFDVNNERVYFIFDVPHLIKTTRNNVQSHRLHIGNEVVNWAHIVKQYYSTRNEITTGPKTN